MFESVAPFSCSNVYSVHLKSALPTLVTFLVKNSWSVDCGTLNVIDPLLVPLFVTPNISLVLLLKLTELFPVVPNSV